MKTDFFQHHSLWRLNVKNKETNAFGNTRMLGGSDFCFRSRESDNWTGSDWVEKQDNWKVKSKGKDTGENGWNLCFKNKFRTYYPFVNFLILQIISVNCSN